MKVGDEVCCCDCKHRTIESIEEVNDDIAKMTDGSYYSLKYCVEPVREDGSCHYEY